MKKRDRLDKILERKGYATLNFYFHSSYYSIEHILPPFHKIFHFKILFYKKCHYVFSIQNFE